jgi:hypothetical protein
MGSLSGYGRIYRELTGQKLNWRGSFGFAYRRLGISDDSFIRRTLARDRDLKYEDPETFVRYVKIRSEKLYDPTLAMLKEMDIGDF